MANPDRSQDRSARGKFVAGHKAGFKPGQSGNPKGRPSGQTRLEQFITNLKIDEKNLQRTEVRERFRILNEVYRWFDIAISQEGFPEFVFRTSAEGEFIRAAVEVSSSSFPPRGHDPKECDLIICWRHNWSNCPLPVLTLSVEWANYSQLRQVKPWVFKPPD